MSEPRGDRPRVFIVDDHGLFRSGVRSELGTDVEVVGEADDVGPAIAGIAHLEPDVVLLDVHLPGGGGHAVVTAVRACRAHVTGVNPSFERGIRHAQTLGRRSYRDE